MRPASSASSAGFQPAQEAVEVVSAPVRHASPRSVRPGVSSTAGNAGSIGPIQRRRVQRGRRILVDAADPHAAARAHILAGWPDGAHDGKLGRRCAALMAAADPSRSRSVQAAGELWSRLVQSTRARSTMTMTTSTSMPMAKGDVRAFRNVSPNDFSAAVAPPR